MQNGQKIRKNRNFPEKYEKIGILSENWKKKIGMLDTLQVFTKHN